MFCEEEEWEDGQAVKDRIAEREARLVQEEKKRETQRAIEPLRGILQSW
jgi:hypothetical protein